MDGTANDVRSVHSEVCFHCFCVCQRAKLMYSVSDGQTEPSEDVEQSVGKPYFSEKELDL